MIDALNRDIVEALRMRESWIIYVIKDENLVNIQWMMYDFGIFQYPIEDMFNDVVFNLYKSIDRPEFILNCDIHKYVMKIASRQMQFFKYRHWNEKRIETTDLREAVDIGVSPIYEQRFDMEMLFSIVSRNISKLALACKQILSFILKGYSHKEIAVRMKIKQADVRRRKWKCRDKLINLMNDDPEYCKIKGEDDQFKMEAS